MNERSMSSKPNSLNNILYSEASMLAWYSGSPPYEPMASPWPKPALNIKIALGAACAANIGPWQEYKKGVETYGKWFDPPLRITDGAISVPKGAGVGIADPKELLTDATVVKG